MVVKSLKSGRSKCGAQFCYVCGVRWKECASETADVDRIEEQAEEIVDIDEELDILDDTRYERTEEIGRALLDHNQCDHPQCFQRITEGTPIGGFRCVVCQERNDEYILECEECLLEACEDCRDFSL
jgi:hypothetical protein